MAASSSSNSRNSNPVPPWRYHVFLSFRGEDTRYTFTDHLYAALWKKGIITFRDKEEIERGEVIKDELVQAIDESLCIVVILSQNYASSTWCLDELQKILESRKALGREVMPIFYCINPSTVRYQTDSFAEAFKKHEERFEDKAKVQRWRDALSEVCSLSGYHLKNRSEVESIEEIATELWKKLEPNLPSYINDELVGIDTKLEDMYKILEIGAAKVHFVGIWGMGGIGKTTLAKFVFNKIRSHFDISCCLENIREKSSVMDGLLGLQKKLISNLKIRDLEIDNLDQGKATIRNLLFHKKVILLLDDVDDIRQLEHLAGKKDWFGQGSRVIVTTRDMHLLELHEGPFSNYKIGILNIDESHELFCQKAFKTKQPKEGYEEWSKIFLQYCQGLPLALTVLGSHLYGRDVSIWEDAFQKIKKDSPKNILDTLRVSFEGLEDAEKTLFLDIACFFKGWNKNRVMQIFEICDFNPKIGIEILIERSLLTCDYETFEMHDLLQEMGRKIVIKKSGNEINKQSRLWSPRDVDEVLKRNNGTEFIEGIVLSMRDYKTCWDPKAFSKMCNLRILIIFHGLHLQLPLGLKCFSNSIKVLEWSEYSLQLLPLGVKLEKLVELKLHGSKIKQLWNGSQNFDILKFVDLSYSKDLIHTPNFFGVPNLESLILEGCSNLVKIHQSIGQLKKLVVLNLKDCINLKYLPNKMETTSLKDLNLCGCSKVEKFLEFVENLNENKSMERLNLSEMTIVEVPSFVGRFKNLKWLSVCGCKGSIFKPWWKFWGDSIPMGLKLPPLSSLRMLTELDASYCNLNDESVPDLSCLSSLEILRLSGNNFSGNSIVLKLKPSQFSSLSKLKVLELNNCSLNDKSIPDDLSYLSSLKEIFLSENNFVNLPPGCISNLNCLTDLHLRSCPKLRSLPLFPPSLEEFLGNCGPMVRLPETQISHLLLPDEEYIFTHVIIPGKEMLACFEKTFGDSLYSITVDIPDCCLSSEQWRIHLFFCLNKIGHPIDKHTLYVLSDFDPEEECCGYYPLHVKYDQAFNNEGFVFILRGNKPWLGNIAIDGGTSNQLRIFFDAYRFIIKDGCSNHRENIEIQNCVCSLLCMNGRNLKLEHTKGCIMDEMPNCSIM